MPSYKKIALYASYQTGKDLPGYVRFALRHLAATDFHVVLLTNDRELSEETYKFIADNDIELFLTQNHGFDFGMWHRYLKLKVNNPTAGVAQESMGNLDRLLVLNDSIVYFQNNFEKFFAEAEKSTADVVSLTSSNEIYPHLQSFFLYMKQPALGAFFMHLFETPEQEDFLSTVRHMEIGLSEKFVEAEVRMEALYPTEGKALFSARELIEQGSDPLWKKVARAWRPPKGQSFSGSAWAADGKIFPTSPDRKNTIAARDPHWRTFFGQLQDDFFTVGYVIFTKIINTWYFPLENCCLFLQTW